MKLPKPKKLTDLIGLLQRQLDLRGDCEVHFYSAYGAETVEIDVDAKVSAKTPGEVWFWVPLVTG